VKIGIACNLKSDFIPDANDPEDKLEEYDHMGTVDGIAHALEANSHTPLFLGGGRKFIERVLSDPPDLVFNIAEGYGSRSREAHVPALLEMLNIPYTHSDPLTLAMTLDKSICGHVASSMGVPTPAFTVIEREVDIEKIELSYPLFVKPAFEGSSIGIHKNSRVENIDQLRSVALPLLHTYGQPLLVEEYCPGAEFTVGVLGNGADARVIGVMEIVPLKGDMQNFVYSLEVKRNYLEEVQYNVPPQQPAELVRRVEAVALQAYRCLGCRDVSRVDVRVGADGEPKFLEVNPLPGLNHVTGDLVILSGRSGMPYEQLIGSIVNEAFRRYGITR